MWAPLVLLGIEKVRIVPGITATNPLDLFYMPFTHSLVAAILWSIGAFILYRIAVRGASATSAGLVAIAVFSHWALDFIVHRPDLPLYDDTAKVGLGLWNAPVLAFGLETLLFFGGMWLYFRTGVARRRAMIVFGVVMLIAHALVFFGAPPTSPNAAAISALAAYVVFAFVIWLLERKPPLVHEARS
jgi:hypothetical protein